MTKPIEIDEKDRLVLNSLQEGFPISSSPFAKAAKEIGIEENDLIARLIRLRETGLITRFGPFFDAAAMGGAFCLCAMAVPEERFEEITMFVNALPEVAHNYERTHHLNMWFVLATEKEKEISAVCQHIEEQTGIAVLAFPKLEEFYIGFRVAA